MNGELHQELLGVLMPHMMNRQVDEEIIIGLSPLQETLATFDILHKIRCIAPDRIRRRHVDGGVELPTWPGVVLR